MTVAMLVWALWCPWHPPTGMWGSERECRMMRAALRAERCECRQRELFLAREAG
jgi:hypothetical protein